MLITFLLLCRHSQQFSGHWTSSLAATAALSVGHNNGHLDISKTKSYLTRLPPSDSTLDGRWTRKPFGLSSVQPIYLSIPRPS